jgi:hypothetical protein
MDTLTSWSVLVLTFPTENATARMRAWRALKAKGCAVLRDGIYLLPHSAEREDMLRDLANSIDEAGGTAHLLRAQSLNPSQEADFRALFDRNDDYATFVASLGAARKTLGGLPPAEVTRLLRRLRKDYEAIRTIDYFPGAASTDAEVAWEDFLALADTVLSPGEPHAAERAIRSLRRDEYQARTWATRQRLWVDRVASAWLIRRFIDPQARFLWLVSPDACSNGMFKVVIGRTANMHHVLIGNEMGVNTWAAFAGSDDAAVVDGDFAMREDELQAVLKAMRAAGINIVAIHEHMTEEQPRILFLHY